jgi:hypothetical protein
MKIRSKQSQSGTKKMMSQKRTVCQSLSKRNFKNLEPEHGQVLTLSHWYKYNCPMGHLKMSHGTIVFVQVHFTTDEMCPGSGSYFF